VTLKNDSTPKVVALGGGHGLATVLRSLKSYAGTITGIVSVADNGGSSGLLRDQYQISAPGDIRRCISALANDQGVLTQNLEKRFTSGDLTGHPIGNLILASLTLATGDFQSAIDELCRLTKAAGEIYPATVNPVSLIGTTATGPIIGQVAIEDSAKDNILVSSISFDSKSLFAPAKALQRIAEADQIIFGPGSMFTSVIAAIAVPDITQAINASNGQNIYVANIKNDAPGIEEDDIGYQVELINSHGVKIDKVIYPAEISIQNDNSDWLKADLLAANGLRHDSNKLAKVLESILS